VKMGILNPLFDFAYDLAKVKKPKPAPPEPEKPKEKQKVTVVKESPPPKDDFGPVVQRPTLQPVQYSQIIQHREPITPEKLKAAADALEIFAKREAEPIPDFNIDDLKQKLQNFNPGDLPLDLRSIGAAADTVYGTKIAQSMPDSRTRALEDLKSIRALMGDSQALQQVQAQGRLAKYKATIDRNKPWTPEQIAHAYKFAADAIGGGGGSAADRAAWQQGKAQADANQSAEKSNNETKNKLIQDTMDQQKEWRKDKVVDSAQKIFNQGKSLRNALSKRSGIGDQQAIISYLHGIEPTSIVMKSESDAMIASTPIMDRLMNLRERFKNGDKIPPDSRREIITLMTELEDAAEQDYLNARQGKGQSLALAGIPPEHVLGPVDKMVQRDKGSFLFKMPDGSTASVQVRELGDFLYHVSTKNIKVVPLGRGKK